MTEQQKHTHVHDRGGMGLVDLVAVCIRYRRLLLVFPLLITALAAVYLYLGPVITGDPVLREAVFIQKQITREVVPREIYRYMSGRPEDIALRHFADTRLVMGAFEAVDWLDPELRRAGDRSRGELSAFIRREISGARLTAEWMEDNEVLTVGFTSVDEAGALLFLENLLRAVTRAYERDLRADLLRAEERAGREIAALRGALSRMDGGAAIGEVEMSPEALLVRELVAETLEDLPSLSMIDDDVLVFDSDRDNADDLRVQQLLLLYLGALLFSVLLAFALNYRRILQNDAEASEILLRAWKGL